MLKSNAHHTPFLVFAAICSFAGALTTALLIFLPNPEAADFDSQSLLFQNQLYISKLWILFFHPQVNMLASLGIATILLKKYPMQIITGTFFLAVWAFSEMMQQSLLIDALNQIWRPGYSGAENEVTQTMYSTLIRGAQGIADSNYFLVIYGFGLGSLLYGLAFIRLSGWGKWIGIALVFIGMLSLASFARYYLGAGQLSTYVDAAYEWIYPYLQPLVRLAIGIWIIAEIRRDP